MKSSGATYLNNEAEELDEVSEGTTEQVATLLKASLEAADDETALEYAQRAADALPDDPQVQESVQRSIFNRLNNDAFVAFLAETHKHYIITFRNARPVVVPKSRTQPEIFPVKKQTDGEHTVGMLWWLLLGLVPVGIGALVLSPLIVGYALDVLWRNGIEPREKRMAWVAVFLAAMLGLLGMFFTLLLVLHVIG